MSKKLVAQLAAGLVGSLLVGQVARAQMQTSGNTTPSTSGRTGVGSSASGSNAPLGGNTGPGGMTLQGLDFTQGATDASGGVTGGASTKNARRRTSRSGATSGAGMTGGLQGASLGNAGRGGTSTMQTNRQTENRAQYGMRMDLAAFQGASSNGAASGTPGSTIQVRTAVERSVASVVPSGANVTMDGSNAILSGMVSSEHDRKLVERMALLVPGVQAVRNELVVQVTSPTKL